MTFDLQFFKTRKGNVRFLKLTFLAFASSLIRIEASVVADSATSTKGSDMERSVVTVFYETLCPYSIEFFRKQLIPVWDKIGDEYLDLRLVPYGNGHTFFQQGLVVHGCDHGKEECYGNKLHACVLEYLPKNVARDFIFCSMMSDYPPLSASNCSIHVPLELNFNSDILDYCVEGLAGDLALALKGLQSLDFVGNGVPSISVNGVLTESDDPFEDFLTYICNTLANPPNRNLETDLSQLPQLCYSINTKE